jgi:hypothetical protein
MCLDFLRRFSVSWGMFNTLSTSSLGIYWPTVFKSQDRLKHPPGNKTHILRNISFNLWQRETLNFQHTISWNPSMSWGWESISDLSRTH